MSVLFSLLMLLGFAHAQGPESCPDIIERQEGTQIHQTWSEGSQTCFFSVSPLDAYYDLIYRDHLFTSDGLFMVFNSYGPGAESETTGAREFYFLPRPLSQFVFIWNFDAKELEVTHVSGDKFIFDARKARLKTISRAQVTVADEVNKINKGGIEITRYQGLLLDGGFKMGSAPTSVANANSVIKDSSGASCRVKNQEVFKYTSDGDVIFRFSDTTLPGFLKNRCPQLKKP